MCPFRHRPDWSRHPHKRRFLLWRFAFVFIPIMIVFLLGMGTLLSLVFSLFNQTMPRPAGMGMILIFCGIPIAFITAAAIVGGAIFRNVGRPIADVMAAADAVAEGDLTVRVRENVPGEFGQLARSFNRMASELDRADQQRRNLTADVAHELRTPLQIIQGNLEGILDGVYQPDREQIAATLEETRLLARLVNDLQTLSRAEAGQLPLHRADVSVADLLSDVQTSFSGQAAAAGIQLVLEIPQNFRDLSFSVDPDRIDQVLSNLVANAIRMTPDGGKIVLRASSDGEQIQMEVEDSGPGITPEDLPYIFDRFYRGDRARTRQAGTGSGLGLAIARQLIQAHGGTIEAFSPPGKGALIRIRLPFAPAP